MITKPPFDYQDDNILDFILDSCENIEDLANAIIAHGQLGNILWEYRQENIKSGHLKKRNEAYFAEFWG